MPNILLEDVLKANKKFLREEKQLDTNALESAQSDCSAGPLSDEHKKMIKNLIEKQKLTYSNAPDILDSYDDECEFVVELDNSNPTYIASLEEDLYKLEDDYDIGYEKESNGNGFYAYSYRFFYYQD